MEVKKRTAPETAEKTIVRTLYGKGDKVTELSINLFSVAHSAIEPQARRQGYNHHKTPPSRLDRKFPLHRRIAYAETSSVPDQPLEGPFEARAFGLPQAEGQGGKAKPDCPAPGLS
jgi:hypothetical protein